ncbi:unnamed protein product [Pelagomonas calceolata]|uniref:Vacuolar protein 8 n=1 Tax=Pelagomonas calceolata TaxID=35677 RepID=A0A8J2SJ73_9STRA|nr:unnamed protein product [Pelagomonas calceolata]
MAPPDAQNGHAPSNGATESNGAPEQATAPLMPPAAAALVKDAPALQTITRGELMDTPPPPPPDADDADARPLEDHLRECVAVLKRRKGREEPVALLLRDFCAAHPDQRHKVVKAGCIGPLIGLVRSSRTGSCKGAAAAALAQLAYDDEGNRQAILACEGEKPLGALVVDRNAPPTARASACDCLANLAAGAADGVVAARLHVAAFTALATDDESSFDVKASAARALANALRPLEDVEDEAVNPSLSQCALELLASDHREAGASLARALVLATELDEGTVKKLSAALVAAIDSDGAIGALANLLARGATAAPSVLPKLVATRSQASIVCIGNFALKDAGAVVDCGAVPVLADCLGDEALRRSACAALRNVAASNPGAVAPFSEALARVLGEVPNEAAGALQNIAMVQPAAVATYAPELAVALKDAPRKAACALAHIAARDPADVPVTPLVEALNNAKSASAACCALACVASDTPGRAALVDAKGVPSLVALLEDDDAKCACAAAHVIRNLACDDKGRRALLINGGAAALSAAGLEGDDEAAQLRVEAIANLCLGDAADRTAVVNAKCIRPLAKRAHVLKCGAAADALDRLSVDEAALVNKARAALTPKKATPRRLGPRRLGPTRKPAPYQCVSPVPPASADGPDSVL